MTIHYLTGGGSKQSYNDADGKSVFCYEGKDTYIERFFTGTWHTYGPFRKGDN